MSDSSSFRLYTARSIEMTITRNDSFVTTYSVVEPADRHEVKPSATIYEEYEPNLLVNPIPLSELFNIEVDHSIAADDWTVQAIFIKREMSVRSVRRGLYRESSSFHIVAKHKDRSADASDA